MEEGSLLVFFAICILTVLYLIQPLYHYKNHSLTFTRENIAKLRGELEWINSSIQRIEKKNEGNQSQTEWQKVLIFYQDKKKSVQESIAHYKQIELMLSDEGYNIISQDFESKSMDDKLEELIAAYRRKQQEERAAGFCSQCGSPLRKGDQYCWFCGVKAE